MNEEVRKHIFLVILGLCIFITGVYFLYPGNEYVWHYKTNYMNCTELQDGQFDCTEEWISTGGNIPIMLPLGGSIIGGFLFIMSSYSLLNPPTWRSEDGN